MSSSCTSIEKFWEAVLLCCITKNTLMQIIKWQRLINSQLSRSASICKFLVFPNAPSAESIVDINSWSKFIFVGFMLFFHAIYLSRLTLESGAETSLSGLPDHTGKILLRQIATLTQLWLVKISPVFFFFFQFAKTVIKLICIYIWTLFNPSFGFHWLVTRWSSVEKH